jgi:4-hydroxybenzoate polyprenyltransferase
VTVDGALLFGGALYLSTLVAAAWLEPRELRLMVACSAAVTLAYTPVLKKIALAKTAAVAGVIALSPAAGALAVSAAAAGPSSSLTAASPLAAVAPACWLAFFAVSGRELLMDAADARGDGAAGVATLPVLIGRGATLRLAAGCEVLAAALLCSRAAASAAVAFSGSGRRGAFSLVIPAAAVALGAALVAPAARAAREAARLGRLRKEEERRRDSASSTSPVAAAALAEAEAAVSAAISRAVNTMMRPMGLAIVAALVLG